MVKTQGFDNTFRKPDLLCFWIYDQKTHSLQKNTNGCSFAFHMFHRREAPFLAHVHRREAPFFLIFPHIVHQAPPPNHILAVFSCFWTIYYLIMFIMFIMTFWTFWTFWSTHQNARRLHLLFIIFIIFIMVCGEHP